MRRLAPTQNEPEKPRFYPRQARFRPSGTRERPQPKRPPGPRTPTWHRLPASRIPLCPPSLSLATRFSPFLPLPITMEDTSHEHLWNH